MINSSNRRRDSACWVPFILYELVLQVIQGAKQPDLPLRGPGKGVACDICRWMMPCCLDPCKANEVHSGSMGIRMRLGLDSSSVTAIEVVVLRPNRCQEMILP